MAQTVVSGLDVKDKTTLYISVLDSNGKKISEGQIVHLYNKNTVNLEVTAHGYVSRKIQALPNQSYKLLLMPNSFELNTVVVSDIHQGSTVSNSVLNLTKISAKKIEQLGATDLADALSFENNITLSRDNALGSKGISLMGLGGENVKILKDGVPVIGRFFGQLDLEQFNLENVKQVEIIQGPMSVIYGSNALAGTINLVSQQNNFTGITTLLNYETDGQYNISGTASKALKNGGIKLSLGRTFFDGWSENKIDRSYDWIPKEQYTGDLAFRYIRKRSTLTLRTAVLQARLLDKGRPSAPYGESAIDQKFTNKRLDNTVIWRRDGRKVNVNISAANNHFYRTKNKYIKNLITLEENLVPIATEQDTQIFNASVLRGVFNVNKWHGISTVFGFDGNYEKGNGKRIKHKTKDQLDLASFLSADKTFNEKLTVRLGARYAYNSSFTTPLVYSVQTKFNFKKSRLLKIAYGKGFRAPSLKELYLNFVDSNHEVVGNDNLKAERSHSLTATYSQYKKINRWNVNGTLDAFANSITDKIDLIITSATAGKYGNIGLYQSIGGKVGAVATNDKITLRAGYSYTGVYNGVGTEYRKFIYTPQLVLQTAYKFAKTNTSIQLFYNRYGKISRVFEGTSGENVALTQEAYGMLDATLSQNIWKQQLRMTTGVRNLLQVTSLNSTSVTSGAHSTASSSTTISQGRTFFISLRYAFKK
ncbi:MAG: hypothetical protein COA58_14740 [Bacteroidetes bacterium]|nr:MAG: hypothetical protein COA58_14740 [Bacteroidota bacterium]